VFAVILFEDTLQLVEVHVGVENHVDCLEENYWKSNEDASEVDHQGFEAEGAAHDGEVVLVKLLFNTYDGDGSEDAE